ncbi:hypothetical protein ACP_0382 [Acidobacterium capsulatum ATCC 51196]|uniref:Uncharacterized protein n=1 Tax=Acidobacterium capsulatum (strain ATCC 51196 / DSM 11244 / BCRC 80197 / JCM 7670 / NBRC 15755 / NCIMB 13165 / 161) TaxID=240015 RepID=C1FA03_ACIC5|nr:hypothetical protein ACP_0382 [Acidobacterium capsulatum ATCC 51196]
MQWVIRDSAMVLALLGEELALFLCMARVRRAIVFVIADADGAFVAERLIAGALAVLHRVIAEPRGPAFGAVAAAAAGTATALAYENRTAGENVDCWHQCTFAFIETFGRTALKAPASIPDGMPLNFAWLAT